MRMRAHPHGIDRSSLVAIHVSIKSFSKTPPSSRNFMIRLRAGQEASRRARQRRDLRRFLSVEFVDVLSSGSPGWIFFFTLQACPSAWPQTPDRGCTTDRAAETRAFRFRAWRIHRKSVPRRSDCVAEYADYRRLVTGYQPLVTNSCRRAMPQAPGVLQQPAGHSATPFQKGPHTCLRQKALLLGP